MFNKYLLNEYIKYFDQMVGVMLGIRINYTIKHTVLGRLHIYAKNKTVTLTLYVKYDTIY